MKNMLKSEICGSREQCTKLTDVLKSQILWLLFMNSAWIVIVTVLFAPETHAKKKEKKKSKTCKRVNLDAKTCIQTDTIFKN